jgi:hypothetical protein
LNDGFVYALAKKMESVRSHATSQWDTWRSTGGAASVLWIELPSPAGGCTTADPELVSTPKGPAVAYYGRDRTSGGWTYVRTYGGKLAENVTQAISRDVIALRCSAWMSRATIYR